MSERIRVTVSTDSTQIPDWLLLCDRLSLQARVLAGVILYHQKQGEAPTYSTLAGDLRVDTRTIVRWLDELRGEKIIDSTRIGRGNVYRFLKPRKSRKHDRRIIDPSIIDPSIIDPSIIDPSITCQTASGRRKPTNRGNSAENAPVVGVGHDSFEEKEPTISNRAPLKTELARWLKQAGLNAARQFDNPELDYWTYRRFVEEKRAAGWEWRQIVSTLREAPLDRDLHAAPAPADVDQADDDQADDQADDQVPRVGRTVEEAQARYDALIRKRYFG